MLTLNGILQVATASWVKDAFTGCPLSCRRCGSVTKNWRSSFGAVFARILVCSCHVVEITAVAAVTFRKHGLVTALQAFSEFSTFARWCSPLVKLLSFIHRPTVFVVLECAENPLQFSANHYLHCLNCVPLILSLNMDVMLSIAPASFPLALLLFYEFAVFID